MKRKELIDNLSRLDSIRRSDVGFYALALHSFIEAWASEHVGSAGEDLSFRDIIQSWVRDHLDTFPNLDKDDKDSENKLRSILRDITRSHFLTNKVRHDFVRLTSEEARSATWNFLSLGHYAGWSSTPAIQPIKKSLDSWEERESAAEDSELADLKISLKDLQRRSPELLAQRGELAEKERKILAYKQKLYEAEHNGPTGPGGNRTADNLRLAIRLCRDEIEKSEYRQYIYGLSRFTDTARTRRDFEKQIVRLTPEQREVLSDFSAERDMLITGSAGTGKSLVLLEALARTLNARSAKTVLITYTKTLVKYNRYMASLMAPERIHEADLDSSETFFWKKLSVREPGHLVDYNLLHKMIAEVNGTGVLSNAELHVEIEEFLFGLNISREEYLSTSAPRRGLKTPLNLAEREKVWGIREKLVNQMKAKGVYSKNYARVRLLEHLTKDPTGLISHEHIFVDESQDMFAVELMCLKALAGRSLIMAGDTGQSIYGFLDPYNRAGLNLNQSQICRMKTNHRNTIPIHNMAEKLRRSGLVPGENPDPGSYPFREGPDPEIHRLENPDALSDLLAAKARMYVEDLGYPPESIGILCSRTAHLETVSGKLNKAGLDSAPVKGENFEFSGAGAVRLSTLHSSKGLDFPVVLLYLPERPPAQEIDPSHQDRLYRNLQYVAVSRGMDVVEKFSVGD